MSHDAYKIDIDYGKRLVRTTITGFWDLPATMAYITEIRAITEKMKTLGGSFDLLMHIGKAPPLPRESAEYIEKEQGDGRPDHVRKMAYVCFSILGRLQLRRITSHDKNMGVFATDAEAEKWLAE